MGLDMELSATSIHTWVCSVVRRFFFIYFISLLLLFATQTAYYKPWNDLISFFRFGYNRYTVVAVVVDDVVVVSFGFSFFVRKFMLSISRLISTSLRTTTMCFTPFLRFAFALGVSPVSIVSVCLCRKYNHIFIRAHKHIYTRTHTHRHRQTNESKGMLRTSILM